MMPYDAKEQHFPWSSSALSTLSGACGNPISSSSPHTQTDTQANTSMNTQTITGANTQAQTHKHKNTNNYRYTQIKLDKFILVHYNDQLIMTPVTLICVNANQRRLSGWEGSERGPTVDENSLCLPHLQWQHLLRHCHHTFVLQHLHITLKSIEEEQNNQPGQDEKDRSRKGRKKKKKKMRRWASRRSDSRKMRKIDQGRGEWMSRLSQGRLSSLSIWSQDHYDQVPSHLPSHPGHLSMCLTITLTKYSHTGIEPPAPRQVHHEEKVTPPTECQEHLSVRTSASGGGRNPPRVTLWICRCVTSQEPGALPFAISASQL